MQFQTPSVPVSYSPPDEAISDVEKDVNWYVQWVRYFSTYYNQSRSRQRLSDDNQSTNVNKDIILAVADEIRDNFDYYFGRQDNIDFNFLTEDSSGNTVQNPWVKGKHAAKLMDFMKGPALQVLDKLEFSAKTIDPDVLKDKAELFSQVELRQDLKKELDLLKQFGIEFNPIHDEFSLDEEMDDWKQDYQSAGEELAVNTANELYENNNAKYRYLNAWLHTIVGGIGCIVNEMKGGRLVKRHIRSDHAIYDNRIDSDFVEYGRFGGYIQQLSVGEVISRWKNQLENLGPEVIDEIKSLAKNEGSAQDFVNYYNSGISNFSWYNRTPNSMMISCVTMYFLAPRDVRYKKTRNKWGEKRVSKVSIEEAKAGKKGDVITMDLHQCTLIGNKWPVDWGLAPNVVRDYKNKGNPIPPISFFIPNMTNGEPRATMSMLKNNQNEIDRLGHIIRGLTGKDKGRVAFYRGPQNDAFNILKANDDLTNLGFTYIPYSADLPDDAKAQKWLEVADLSQMQHISEYVKLRQEEERIMEEILNLSKAALGQMNGYISQGAQEKSTSLSSMGTSYLYDGFQKFIEMDTRLGVNMQKMNFSVNKESEMIRFTNGRSGIKFLTVTQQQRYEEVLIYLKIQDTVDMQARQRILSYAQAWSQNPEFGVDPIDILNLERERTWSGMIKKLTYSMKRKKAEAKNAQAQQMMLDKVNSERNAQMQLAQEAMRQHGATERTGLQEQGKAFASTLNHHAATQQPTPSV